jgi:hypothetical protein
MKVIKILLGFVAFLALIVIGSSVANYVLIPRRASRTTLEATFRDQIARLREIAYDHKARWNTTVEGCEADRRLFARPEILHASVEPAPNYHLIVGNSEFVGQSYWFFNTVSFSDTRATRRWYTLSSNAVNVLSLDV